MAKRHPKWEKKHPYRHEEPRTEVNGMVGHMVRQLYLTGQFSRPQLATTCNLTVGLVRTILTRIRKKPTKV